MTSHKHQDENKYMFSEPLNNPLQKIELELAEEKGIEIYMKRDDLIHPEISGNKWRKLKYNLLKARADGKEMIVTLGGAYSNHIAATAALGKEFGIRTKGIIRGDEIKELNPTLQEAKDKGMELEFISREYYAERNEDWFRKEILERHDRSYFIPEGGANFYGVQGCMEIVPETNIDFDHFCVAAGTGTTAAGIAQTLKEDQKLHVFPALKGGDFLRGEIKNLINICTADDEASEDIMEQVHLHTDYHFGGYAKISDELITFIQDFCTHNEIRLDPIYTGKMCYGIVELIRQNAFNEKDRIVILHTGGLQGIKGIEDRYGIKIYS